MSTRQLSVMSYTMARGKWWEKPDVRKLCEFTRSIGIDGIDFVTTYGTPAQEVRKISDGCGLKVVCYTFFPHSRSAEEKDLREEVDAVNAGLETALTLGAPIIMLPIVAKEGKTQDESRGYCREFLSKAVALGEKYRLAVSFENRNPIITTDHVNDILRQLPGLMVTLDNGNILMGGDDPVSAINSYGKRIIHAHFKDYRKDPQGQCCPCILGEGMVDQAGCLEGLKKAGYKGHINIEYDGGEFEPDIATTRSAEYLRGLLNLK